jgi:hypothetical protein
MDSAVQNFFHLDQTADRPNIWFEENFNAEKQTRSLELLIRSLHR